MKPFKIPESVLVVIHTPQREVLLLERADHPGFWQSVTGSRDTPDEVLSLTAAREVQEETGIAANATPVTATPNKIVNSCFFISITSFFDG